MSKSSTTVLMAFSIGLSLLIGCGLESVMDANLPPSTTLVVDSGSVIDTTQYMQVLSWHGEDLDGEVVRYEYKWTLDESVAAEDFDTNWVGLVEPFVNWTSDTFYLPVPTGTAFHHFQVRAVDDQDARDPSPAEALFPVFNLEPQIWAVMDGDTSTTLVLPDTILPVLSIQFLVEDPDDSSGEGIFLDEVRVWFDDESEYIAVPATDTLVTLRPEDFGDDIGVERQISLQARDKGGAVSNVLSATAHVKDISAARVLMLDSADSQSSSVQIVDAFWQGSVRGLFEDPAAVYLHDFEESGSLGHPDNLDLIFSLFEAVLWYNGGAGKADYQYSSEPTPEISVAEDALVSYAEEGGKVFLAGWNLVGASASPICGGSFTSRFEAEVILVDSLYVHDTNTPGGQNSSNRRLYPNREILGFAAVGTDTLQNRTAFAGIDLMAPNADALESGIVEKLFMVNGEDVTPQSLWDGTVGVRRLYEDTGGELLLLSFPISLAFGYGNEVEQIQAFLQGFGVLP